MERGITIYGGHAMSGYETDIVGYVDQPSPLAVDASEVAQGLQWQGNQDSFFGNARLQRGEGSRIWGSRREEHGSGMRNSGMSSSGDATYDSKYGVRAVPGGGRSSTRETIGRVSAGAIAKTILRAYSGTEVLAYASQVHDIVLPKDSVNHETLTLNQIESNIVRCPDPEYFEKMIASIDAVRVQGDSVGGVVTCIARNVPRGLGSPVFDKLAAELAKAITSIPATMGFEFGSGFAGTIMQRGLQMFHCPVFGTVPFRRHRVLMLLESGYNCFPFYTCRYLLTGSQHNDVFYIDERGNLSLSLCKYFF
ncbi:hypothetical protein IFM89_016923 [Coptis chinensis]|uniref:chorismate synthase n=1 Tax=Coptis chinensis TaxID=261450 RepID=A0A835HT01_9MAGN|nr:hypothetical protein IFM89_016923 [Coptis chinensis]